MRLLIVEDDTQIAQGLARVLESSGHAVDVTGRVATARAAIRSAHYELVILDLGLPDGDGTTLLRDLRAAGDHTPVLALTARDEVSERVHLLNLGADDYLSKPFALAELEARIGAVTRRAIGHSGGEVRVGQLRFDLSERQVYVADQLLALSPREFGVLEILMLKRGRVVSKSRILEHLCNWDEDLTEAAVELYVHRVRKKIKGTEVTLRTLRGLGYMLQQSDATDNVADDSDELELVSDDSVAANSLSGSGL